MSNVHQLSEHPDYCPKLANLVAKAQQEADGIPRYVTYDCLRFDDSFLTKEQLERLARNERLISDLEGPGAA